MKRIWQISTSLLLGAALASQVCAQGYGPRSWKSYAPASAVDTDVFVGSAEDESDDLPSALGAKRPAGATSQAAAASGDKAATATTAAYYAQNDEPPPAPSLLGEVPQPGAAAPGCDATCTDKIGCADPVACDLSSGCGDVCADCPTRNFARIEYLMWWGRGRALPPLVTTSFNGTPMVDAGVLGEPTTTILYGDNDIGTGLRSGARLTFGRTLDTDGQWMAVGRFYGLGDSSNEFNATSAAGDPILARPFFNVLLNEQDAFLVGFPGVSTDGRINIRSNADMLGAEALIRYLWMGEEGLSIDLVGGYQFNRYDDSLNIRHSELVLLDPQGIFPPNTTISLRDTFRTRNEFHGGVIGLAVDTFRGPWKFEALGKVGFGNQRQTVTIDGNTIITPDVGPVTNAPVGLLARATNSGTYQRDLFTIIPEANFTLGYQKGNWLFTAGYSFMYFKDVAWAGDQVDTRVNLSDPLVGAPLPTFNFRNTDHWLQGASFGAEYNF